MKKLHISELCISCDKENCTCENKIRFNTEAVDKYFKDLFYDKVPIPDKNKLLRAIRLQAILVASNTEVNIKRLNKITFTINTPWLVFVILFFN